MRCTWSLVAPPYAGDGLLHLVRGVLDDLAAGRDRLGHGDARGLADRDGRAHVHLEQHPLDGHHRRLVLARAGRGARRWSSARRAGAGSDGVRAQHADGDRPGARAAAARRTP